MPRVHALRSVAGPTGEWSWSSRRRGVGWLRGAGAYWRPHGARLFGREDRTLLAGSGVRSTTRRGSQALVKEITGEGRTCHRPVEGERRTGPARHALGAVRHGRLRSGDSADPLNSSSSRASWSPVSPWRIRPPSGHDRARTWRTADWPEPPRTPTSRPLLLGAGRRAWRPGERRATQGWSSRADEIWTERRLPMSVVTRSRRVMVTTVDDGRSTRSPSN